MKCFITGVAGFVGSNLADRLLKDGHDVVGYDNFTTGSLKNLEVARTYPNFRCAKADILDLRKLELVMTGCDFVFHLAANADVRHGLKHPARDLEQNTIGTFNVLEAMRTNEIKKIAFSSTGSVYGKNPFIPTTEKEGFPIQNSLYGASKVAGEALIQAYCEGYGFQSWIFRFVSLLGKRYSHGFVVDFYNKLKTNPKRLDVLGDGTVKKSYLSIGDCIGGIILGVEKGKDPVNVFNLGANEFMSVKECAETVTSYLRLSPDFCYGEEKFGWIGDAPFIFLDCEKIRKLGFRPTSTIAESIEDTLDYLINQDCENSL